MGEARQVKDGGRRRGKGGEGASSKHAPAPEPTNRQTREGRQEKRTHEEAHDTLKGSEEAKRDGRGSGGRQSSLGDVLGVADSEGEGEGRRTEAEAQKNYSAGTNGKQERREKGSTSRRGDFRHSRSNSPSVVARRVPLGFAFSSSFVQQTVTAHLDGGCAREREAVACAFLLVFAPSERRRCVEAVPLALQRRNRRTNTLT